MYAELLGPPSPTLFSSSPQFIDWFAAQPHPHKVRNPTPPPPPPPAPPPSFFYLSRF